MFAHHSPTESTRPIACEHVMTPSCAVPEAAALLHTRWLLHTTQAQRQSQAQALPSRHAARPIAGTLSPSGLPGATPACAHAWTSTHGRTHVHGHRHSHKYLWIRRAHVTGTHQTEMRAHVCSHALTQMHAHPAAHRHTLRHECLRTCAYAPFEPRSPQSSGSSGQRLPPWPVPHSLPPGYSQQGSMDAVLDTHHQPWRSHLVAQVVVGVGRQAEVAIHQ